MIKLKQSFGNVKCKIEDEGVVLKYEIGMLQNQPLKGLLSITGEKNLEITYEGDVKKNLANKIQQGMNTHVLASVLAQVARVILDVRRMGLADSKLILNPEWISWNEGSEEIALLYCPINGFGYGYEFVPFAREMLFTAKIDVESRNAIKQWIDLVDKKGLDATMVNRMSAMAGESVSKFVANVTVKKQVAEPYQPVLDADDEAPTGIDDDDDIQFETVNNSFYGEDEAPTGIDDDDDEAPTGIDDDESPTGVEDNHYLYDVMDKADGTFLETTSESGFYSDRPILIRRSTGETIKITKDEFKIGRSQQRADYCITNNNSVSNIHATIFTNNGSDYFVKDNHSTNGTTVDGIKVDANGMSAKLHDGSIISLFNEELEFRF